MTETAQPADHADEYDDAMVAMLELIWGKGFLAPGGAGLVRQTVAGLDLAGKRALDIGCGIGGGDLVLAGELGAEVVGIDLEAPLLARARRYAEEAGLAERVTYRQVEAGPLDFDDGAFDLVYSCGCFTQVADKAGMFAEVRRVLRPVGAFAVYDWMKGPEPYSDDMRYFFKMEGLTYAMETLERHGEILAAAGFTDIELRDDGGWYRDHCRGEYESIQGPLAGEMRERLGRDKQEHFVENWRAMLVVLEKGELRPGFYRARKPD
jgi:phosphoethanolamine N-methyltransferase